MCKAKQRACPAKNKTKRLEPTTPKDKTAEASSDNVPKDGTDPKKEQKDKNKSSLNQPENNPNTPRNEDGTLPTQPTQPIANEVPDSPQTKEPEKQEDNEPKIEKTVMLTLRDKKAGASVKKPPGSDNNKTDAEDDLDTKLYGSQKGKSNATKPVSQVQGVNE